MALDPTPKRWLRLWPWLILLVLIGGAAVVVLAMRSGPAAPTEAMDPPNFVEETSTAGIDHTYDGDFEFFVGGGVTVFDCDLDDRPDLYLAGGENPAALYRNESPRSGELSFARSADPMVAATGVLGAYPIDVDGDANIDLAVLRLGENLMLRGMGDCRFERANEAWGIDGGEAWTAAFSAKWEGDAQLPMLAFGNYIDWPIPDDLAATCADNVVWRPGANSVSRYDDPTVLSPGWCTLSVLFTDWDRSGRRDLRIANDRHYYIGGGEQLWQVAADGPPVLYDSDDGWQAMQIWGMGIASHDVTGDGLPEIFLTSQGDNKLQTLEEGPSQPSFGDIAIRRGVTAHRPFVGDNVLPSTAWHPEFQDVNNDGFVDLMITKGNVEAMVEYTMADPNNLLLGQPDGTFVESAAQAGTASLARSRGAALADFNLDGMLDLVVANRRENVQIWRNVGWGNAENPKPMGNWVALQLSQPGGNRQAIGSWVELRIEDYSVEYESTIGGGHAGDQVGWIHFGLGNSGSAEVRVTWPDGEIGPWLEVAAGTFNHIERGSFEVLPGGQQQ